MSIAAQIAKHPMVQEVWGEGGPEGDGYWAALKPGHCYNPASHCGYDCVHTAHEMTWTELRSAMRDVHKCSCDDCKKS